MAGIKKESSDESEVDCHSITGIGSTKEKILIDESTWKQPLNADRCCADGLQNFLSENELANSRIFLEPSASDTGASTNAKNH